MRKILNNNRGMSEIVAVVITILLVIAVATVIWGVVNKLVRDKTEQVSSCFDADFSDSVFLNNDYTCFNSSSSELHFSLGVGDVDIEKVIVSVAFEGSSKTITLTNNPEIISGLYSYPSRQTQLSLPEKNSGKTYILEGITSTPEWVKVVPYVNGKQCEQSDTIYNPYDCSQFIQ